MRLSEALRTLTILVVDDVRASRALLVGLLRKAGYVRVDEAPGGEEALARLQAGPVDLLLLDLMMPGLDGFELCRRVRAEPETAGLPVLVQTVLERPEDRVRAFACGATDYLTKPVDPNELVARVRIHLANRLLARELEADRARSAAEVETARRLFAAPPGPSVPGVTGRSRLSPNFAGDFWFARDLGQGRAAVWVGDCSGHGVVAALEALRLMALARATPLVPASPADHLRAIEAALGPPRPGRHAALLVGVAEPAEGRFSYASAGAPPPRAWTPAGSLREGEHGGPPLGLGAGRSWRDHALPLPPGGRVLVRTDGVPAPGRGVPGEAGAFLDALVGASAPEDDATVVLVEGMAPG